MKTQWSHLPNAKHIDRILESLKANPQEWKDAWLTYAVNDEFNKAAYYAAWYVTTDAVRFAVHYLIRSAAWYSVRCAARDGILALVAYDECGSLIDCTVDQLIENGSSGALLMIPMARAFELIKKKY